MSSGAKLSHDVAYKTILQVLQSDMEIAALLCDQAWKGVCPVTHEMGWVEAYWSKAARLIALRRPDCVVIILMICSADLDWHIDCRSEVQVDFLMSGLMVLKERVDATEALIAIDLDNRRNDLVAFDLVSLVLFCIIRLNLAAEYKFITIAGLCRCCVGLLY